MGRRLAGWRTPPQHSAVLSDDDGKNDRTAFTCSTYLCCVVVVISACQWLQFNYENRANLCQPASREKDTGNGNNKIIPQTTFLFSQWNNDHPVQIRLLHVCLPLLLRLCQWMANTYVHYHCIDEINTETEKHNYFYANCADQRRRCCCIRSFPFSTSSPSKHSI